MKQLLGILICSLCLSVQASSAWSYVATTNDLISTAIPTIYTNLTATVGGFVSAGDGGGGLFYYWPTNSLGAVDMQNIFPAFGGTNNGTWVRNQPYFWPSVTLRTYSSYSNSPNAFINFAAFRDSTNHLFNFDYIEMGKLNAIDGDKAGYISLSTTDAAGTARIGLRVEGANTSIPALSLGLAKTDASGVFSTLAGTTGYVPYWSSSLLTTTSPIFTDGSSVGIGLVAAPVTTFEVPSSGASALNGISWEYGSNAASRRWMVKNDESSWGSFGILQSTTRTGTSFDVKMTFDANGFAAIKRSLYVGSVVASDPGDNNARVEGFVDSITGFQQNGTAQLGTYLRGDGANFVGAYLALGDATGNLGVPNLNGGTGATSSTFWRGDGTWATPATGAAVANPTGLIGMSIVNGSAATSTRSDGHTAIDPAIAPTWLGGHTFNSGSTDFGSGSAYSVPPVSILKGTLKYNSGGSLSTVAQTTFSKENTTDGNNAGRWTVSTRPNGGLMTDRLYVDSGGLVNIAGLTASRPVLTDASKNLTSVTAISSAYGGLGADFSGIANGSVLYMDLGQGAALAPNTTGTAKVLTQTSSALSWTTAGSGTVTSVAMTVPSALFTSPISGTPITTSGTLALALASQTANKVFASPAGSSGTPTFRAIVVGDLPVQDLTQGTGITVSGGTAATLAAVSIAVDQGFSPTWTGTHLFTGGPTGFGIATPTAGIDVEKVYANGKTFAKFGSSIPIYIVGTSGGSGNPALGFNLYYTNAWKFGKGSSSSFGSVFGFDPTNGKLTYYNTDDFGNADATATLVAAYSVNDVGVFNFPKLTASRYLKLSSAKDLSTGETESANTVFAGPTSGAPAVPAFRALVAADVGLIVPTASSGQISAVGTPYTLTITSAHVVMGTTSPDATISPGVWLLTAIVQVGPNGLTASEDVECKFYNATTGPADVANSARTAQVTANNYGQVVLSNVITVSVTTTIEIWAKIGALGSAFALAPGTSISYIKLSN